MLFLLYLGLIVVSVLLNGFAVNVLWGWFIVTKFNLPPLGIAAAIGVSLIVTVLTQQHIPKGDEDEDENFRKRMLHELGLPILVLVIGWVAHSFV